MIVPRHWARVTSEERTPAGRRVPFSCCQWSERSLAEAQARAREVAERIARRIRAGEALPERYAYGTRPLREEVLRQLRGRGASAPAAGSAPQAAALDTLERFVGSRAGWGFRIYRTRAGLRYLATHATFDPASDESSAAMAALGCDPRYVQLCRSQTSFRARLTPKSWRCETRMPPARRPFEGAAEEARARQWEAKYDAACAQFATCALLTVVGNQ